MMRIVLDRLSWLLGEERLDELQLDSVLSEPRDESERPVVLVFDAIDEASGWVPQRELPIPPPARPVAGIKVLVSARLLAERDARSWLASLGWEHTGTVLELDALSKSGVRAVLDRLDLPLGDDSIRESTVDALYAASDHGDPLLVGLFVEAIGADGFVKLDRLPDLAGGLGNYFELWWDAQRTYWTEVGSDPVIETERATVIFGALSSALGPLTLDELAQLAGIGSAATLREYIRRFGRWIITVSEEHEGFAFAHPRLREYWRDHQMTGDQRARADDKTIEFCRHHLDQLRAGVDPATTPRYVLDYYTAHLGDQRAQAADYDRLICREWWLAHQTVTGSDETFIRDVVRAAECTARGIDMDPSGAAELVSQLFRYALTASALRSLSTNIPGPLLLRLVDADPRRWTPHWAIAQARRQPTRAVTLARLALKLPEELRSDVLAESLVAAQAIADEFLRAEALVGLAAQLPEVMPDALAAAQAITDETARARALVGVSAQLPPELLPDALTAARAITDEFLRAEALAAVAAHLPDLLPPDARRELLADLLLVIARTSTLVTWRLMARRLSQVVSLGGRKACVQAAGWIAALSEWFGPHTQSTAQANQGYSAPEHGNS